MSRKFKIGMVGLLVVAALTVMASGTVLAQEETPDESTPQPFGGHGRGFGRGGMMGGEVALEAAAEALGGVGPGAAEAIPALIQALGGDVSVRVRSAAARALGEIGPEAAETVPALIQALGDENYVVRSAAAEALGSIGPGAVEAVPALVEALEDETWSVRRSAAASLKAITEKDKREEKTHCPAACPRHRCQRRGKPQTRPGSTGGHPGSGG